MTKYKEQDDAYFDQKTKRALSSSQCIPYELKKTYFQQISQFPLLTPDEELMWTKRYATLKKELHTILDSFVNLQVAALLYLHQQGSSFRLVNYLSLSELSLENDSSNDSGFRMKFNQMSERIRTLPPQCLIYAQDPNHPARIEFQKAVHPFILRSHFYDLCLKKLLDDDEEDYQKVLPPEQWLPLKQQLINTRDNLNQAHSTLVERNLRLVINIALHFIKTGMPIADLIQDGNIGLMRAVDKFDYTKGYRFGTYATYWIRQAITKSLTKNCRIIRLSANMISHINLIKRTEIKLLDELGHQPSDEEIAKEMNCSVSNIHAIQKMMQQPISLQTIIDENSTIEDFVSDNSDFYSSSSMLHHSLQGALQDAMELLTEREKTIIQMRYGLIDGQSHTYPDIAKILGLSSERIRQLESIILEKLRIKTSRNE